MSSLRCPEDSLPSPREGPVHLHTRNSQDAFLLQPEKSSCLQDGWYLEAVGSQIMLLRSFPELGPEEKKGRDAWMVWLSG